MSRHTLQICLSAGSVIAGLWVPALAHAQTPAPRPMLVLPFAAEADTPEAKGGGAAFWLGEAAAILLSDELQRLGLPVLSRDDRVRAFDRLQLPASAALTRATMIRVGELVGASEIVIGEVKLGAALSVRARVIRLDAGRQLSDVVEQGPLGDVFALFERAARQIGEGSRRLLAAGPPSRPHPPLEVFENYVKGLVASTPAAQQRFLEAALAGSPGNDRVLLALWDLHTTQGAHEKALAAARGVDPSAPLARRARFATALSLVELSRLADAYAMLDALYAETASPVLSNAMGVIQLRRTPTPQTGYPVFFFNRAVDQEQDNTDYLFNLGYAYALAKDPQAALYWLRETVRYEPAHGDAHLVMSALLAATGKTVEAQRELELARLLGTGVDVVPPAPVERVPPKLERLGSDLDVSPRLRVEAAIGNPAQREQQELAAFHLARGRKLFEQENDREAVSELRRAVYLSPYQDEPHRLLGRLYRRGGRLADAIDAFRVALWCRETAEGRLDLAMALFEADDRAGAKREAERALVLDPTLTGATELLKKIGGPPSSRV